jgi:hypothetical protein
MRIKALGHLTVDLRKGATTKVSKVPEPFRVLLLM